MFREGLSKVLCGYNGRGVIYCKQMDRMFSDLHPSKPWADCGLVDEKYCTSGPTVTSLDVI